MVGAKTTQQGNCSKYAENVPHSCKKDPTVVDLLPGTLYNQQIANCCKGGILSSLLQDPSNAASSFQLTVGEAGTDNKSVKVPINFTLKAPGPGYTCGPAKIIKPTIFITPDGRRMTRALSTGDCFIYEFDFIENEDEDSMIIDKANFLSPKSLVEKIHDDRALETTVQVGMM